MTHGIAVYQPGGITVTNDVLPGGRVWVDYVERGFEAINTQTTYTYDKVPGGANLRVYQVGAGAHSYSTGTNAAGHATLTLTALDSRLGSGISLAQRLTQLVVFAVQTTEPDYGMALVNTAGERTVSTVLPSAEFTGRVTLGAAGAGIALTAHSGYNVYTHTATFSVGDARPRMILWSLPTAGQDVWFAGDDFIAGGPAGSRTITLQAVTTPALAGNYTIPQAFVLALGNQTQSADPWGMRVWNAAGQLMFDGGTKQTVIRGIHNALSYPTAHTLAANTATLSSMSGITPVVSIPTFVREVWEADWWNNSAMGSFDRGFVRRTSATALEARLFRTFQQAVDVGWSADYSFGMWTNLTQLVLHAADHP